MFGELIVICVIMAGILLLSMALTGIAWVMKALIVWIWRRVTDERK